MNHRAASTYLHVLGVAYIISGLWCIFDASGTAAGLGLGFSAPRGISEYITVYGGLQLGLAALFLAAGRIPELTRAVTFYAAFQHTLLASLRGATWLMYGGENRLYLTVWAVEITAAVIGWLVLRRRSTPAA